jgi:acyl-coenzyme A thioesterase PaaI-like protein
MSGGKVANRKKRGGLNLLSWWKKLEGLPFGGALFSWMVGRMAPYTGTIRARVESYREGHAVVSMPDRKKNRNHLRSLHAIALMNLGEIATGLAVLSTVDGRGRGIVTGLRMEYLKKARGKITATSIVEPSVEAGQHTVQGDLVDQEGNTVAVMFATWQIEMF